RRATPCARRRRRSTDCAKIADSPESTMAAQPRVAVLAAACALAAFVGACDRQPATPASTAAATSPAPQVERAPAATTAATTAAAHADGAATAGIAWRDAANDAQVDAAFAAARDEHKPVFMYW